MVINIKPSSFFWAFILIGFLFNPIMPFHINKLTWIFFDAAGAGVFFSFLRNLLRISKGTAK
jgi:hypothetical protein